ncbi:MAG: sugar ABC transporter permease [Clostridiales bacterium]|nr:sugar ABC transporter permease [Clostridiales bacterium]
MLNHTNGGQKKEFRKGKVAFWIWLFPAIIAYGLFKYWPMVYSFILSFANWNFVSDLKWVGFRNYVDMFSKTMFIKGIFNTFKYIVYLFPFFVILPLVFAVMLLGVRNKFAQEFYKTLFFIPNILALSIVCMIWLWIFSSSYGLINNLLTILGIDTVNWLTNSKTAFACIIVVCGWKYLGMNMLLFIAGLLNVSQDCVEAAYIDGANGWQCFWRIKMPLLAPTTVYVVITSVIFAAERAFTAISVLTSGGPSYTTTNLSYVIYEFAFKYYNIGTASAIASFTSIFFLLLTIIMMRTMGGFGYYEE